MALPKTVWTRIELRHVLIICSLQWSLFDKNTLDVLSALEEKVIRNNQCLDTMVERKRQHGFL